MKIYLAARYSRRGEMQKYRADLERCGHQVTSRWIDGDHEIADDLSPQDADQERARFAAEDLDDLLAASCLISFTEPPRSAPSRGGRHVEFGVALGWHLYGKTIRAPEMCYRLIVVGQRENVFHHLYNHVEVVESWGDALRLLGD